MQSFELPIFAKLGALWNRPCSTN